MAKELNNFSGKETVSLGILRGGIIVADQIAKILAADLDIVLSRKLGAPGNPELAIGAVSETGNLFVNQAIASEVGAEKGYIREEKERQMLEISSRIKRFREIKPKVSLKDRIAIVTDDGIATGATMLASLWAIRQENPKKLIAAVPVGAKDSVEKLAEYADETIVLRVPVYFGALSQFYINFSQISDEEVIAVLKQSAKNEKSS